VLLMRGGIVGRLMVYLALACVSPLAVPAVAAAQGPPPAEPPPPRIWDVQFGASFIGTNGNSDTSSVGGDFGLNRRWPLWQVEATALAVRASAEEVQTAERYVGAFRVRRRLKPRIGFTAGTKLERDRFAGIDFRAITDAGLTWALVRRPTWTLDGVTAMAVNQERPIDGLDINHPVGLFELMSRIPFAESGATTQRFTYYPDFEDSEAYRLEFELAAQAAMTERFALKFAYLLRRSNVPVAGFEKNDSTTTASVVVQWRAATVAQTQ
jgi:putative salt-induced outer membrane protein YdiY